MNKKTGILFFSRLPGQEARIKALSACCERNSKMWRHLYRLSLRAARGTHLPLVVIGSADQAGDSFADKITDAIQKAFSTGLDNLVIIGSDCPGLTSKDIMAAAHQLQDGRAIVAGPDQRGGVYLLGIKKKAFDLELFSKFRWQTNELLNDLNSYALKFDCAHILEILPDVHDHSDVMCSLKAGNATSSWRIFVVKLLILTTIKFAFLYLFIKDHLAASKLPLRAPPRLYPI